MFLLTGLTAFSATGIKTVTIEVLGKTIYVDDVPGDEGLDNPPEDYTSIQDAIDDSCWCGTGSWDKILVHSGIYE